MDGVTFAQETITSSLTGKDGATYYVVVNGGAEALDVTAALGFGTVSGASLVVRYDFTGMILTESSFPTPALVVSGGTSTLRQGGKAKDDYVVFLVTGFTGVVAEAVDVILNLDEVAILPGGGSITMHVTDDLSIPADNTASYSGAVRMASAPMPVKEPMDQTALVSEKFLSFGPASAPVQTVTLGSVMLNAVAPGLLNAVTVARRLILVPC